LQWVRAWSEIGLDLSQAHYYPQLERDQKLSLSQQLDSLGDLASRTWIGELPANDPASRDYSLIETLTLCRDAGCAGAGVWRWRPPDADGRDMSFGSVTAETLAAWTEHFPERSSGFRV
jgi:hypothetical protein